jgi:hypothetical protein
LPTGVVNEVGLHHGWARRRNVRRIRASTQERIGRPTDGKITLMMNTKTVIPLLAFLAGFARLGAATPIDIGDRLELFVDRHLIERMDDVRLELGRPRAEEIVFHFNEPWEGSTSGAYFTVIQDGDLHRMYYRGRSVGRDDKAVQVTCYAESRDGIRWEKPKLRIHDYNGSKENNIVYPAEPRVIAHNFCPFLDSRPGVPAAERFKAVGGGSPRGLTRLVSADGLHWREFRPDPVFANYALDSMNVPMWSPSEQVYAIYLRTLEGDPKPPGTKRPPGAVRTVSRSISRDFVTWSKPEPMDFGGAPMEHLYTNATQPYFRAPHLLIALPMRFVPNRRVLSREEMDRFGVGATQRTATGDSVLMTSRGGNRYDRTFMESFIRPGLDRKTWSARNNYPGLGIVPTGPAEMSIYVSGHYTLPDNHLRRYSMRTDGFASIRAPYAGGELLTKPLRFTGRRLVLNYSTSAAGSVRVEVQDEAGRPLAEFSGGEADEIVGDEITHVVTWKGRNDLSGLAGRAVRLRFILKDADLYSFRFER